MKNELTAKKKSPTIKRIFDILFLILSLFPIICLCLITVYLIR
jgi:nitrate reductase NapE component